jgi:hypothetical protein
MAQVLKMRFLVRSRTAAEWTALNEVLLASTEGTGAREMGMEEDTGKYKLGDGVTRWNDLPYQAGGGGDPIAGDGIAIDKTNPQQPIFSSTLGSIALTGRRDDYAHLPTGLGSGDDGKAYLSDEDNLIYTWNGSAFQAKGSGTNGAGNVFARDPYAAYVTSLKRFKAGVPLTFDDVNAPWGNHTNPTAPLSARGLECAGGKGMFSAENNAFTFTVRVGELATIDLWFIGDDNTRGNLATNRPVSNPGAGWLIRREAGGALLVADVGGASLTTATGVVPAGAWHFVRVRYTPTQCQLFVNGVAKGSFTRTTYTATTDPVTLGYSVNVVSDSLAGAIKSFRFTQGYARDGAEVPPVFF